MVSRGSSNIICDRALSRAHLARLAVIESVIAGAIDEMQLTSSQVVISGQVIDRTSVAPATPTPPVSSVEPVTIRFQPSHPVTQGRTRRAGDAAHEPPEPITADLDCTIDRPLRGMTGTKHPSEPLAGASAAPAWKWRADSEVRRETRFVWLKTAGLAVIGMGVVLIAGGIAVTAPRMRGAASIQTPASEATAPSVA